MVVIDNGVNRVRDLLSSDIFKGQLGTDGTAPAETQTGLISAVGATLLAFDDTTTSDKQISTTYTLPQTVGNETILEIFFYRQASILETHDQIFYRFTGQGLGLKHRTSLRNVIERFNSISLTFEGKKLICQYVGIP